MKHKSHYK